MKKVLFFSVLLILGLIGSQQKEALQFLPDQAIETATMFFLGFIMIHVGYEFEIEKIKWRGYAIDFAVATTAAAIPWVFCALYFCFVLFSPEDRQSMLVWKQSFLAGCFAAPTSAGILFSMLGAAGLSATWVFQKARNLAIFDDIAAILFLIPLKMFFIGLRWELAIVAVILILLLWIAWKFLHRIQWPVTWPSVMFYSGSILLFSHILERVASVHIEVLLPAFVVGCVLARPSQPRHSDAEEQKTATYVTAAFMCLVGLSMPKISISSEWKMILMHTLAITFLSNLGKMFPFLCYKKEATSNERLALCIGMWPRGEVGAGVLALAISYGFGGPLVAIATLCLALNLICTGFFIVAVKKLIRTPAT